MKKFLLYISLAILFANPLQSQTLIKDINPGISASSPSIIGEVTNGFILYATDATNGNELWFSNGTALGSKMLKDINPGPSGSSFNSFFVKIKTDWFFVARHTSNQWSLWKSDGTVDGTIMIKDLLNIPLGGTPQILMTAHKDQLFFSYENPKDGSGKELWKSDGTISGTVMVKDINLSSSSNPSGLTSFGNELFFFANDGSHGNELWKSDGTEAGTVLVKDIYPGDTSSFKYLAPSLMVFKNKLYFGASRDYIEDIELFVSDGTEAGTDLFIEINSFGAALPSLLLTTDNYLFFSAMNNITGVEPWISDGTIKGTKMLKDIHSGASSSYPNAAEFINNKIVFNAIDDVNSSELWVTDGTEVGTYLLKDIYNGNNASYPSAKVSLGNRLFFSARDLAGGTELWETDGTINGTVLQKDINPGKASSNVSKIFPWHNELYFSAAIDNDSLGYELYKLKPTPSISKINPIITPQTNIYPNPIGPGTLLKINVNENAGFSAEIISFDGKLIVQKKFDEGESEWTIPHDLTNGIYFIRIFSSKSVIYKRIEILN